jgi:hypothetical protein
LQTYTRRISNERAVNEVGSTPVQVVTLVREFWPGLTSARGGKCADLGRLWGGLAITLP